MADSDFERIIENFKDIYKDIPLSSKRDIITTTLRNLVNPQLPDFILTNQIPLAANILRLIIEEKIIGLNFILSILVTFTQNRIGLFLIGMAFRMGANPNVYYPYQGYGNLHLLCILSLRKGELTDYYFRYIVMLLRKFGSNINYPAINLKKFDTSDLDMQYVERVAKESPDAKDMNISVQDFIREQGKLPDEDYIDFLDTIDQQMLIDFTIAYGEVELFDRLAEQEFFKEIFGRGEESNNALLSLFYNLSTAHSTAIVNQITNKIIPNINEATINSQRIPIYTAVTSCDKDMFKLLAQKGSDIKYVSITQLIANYKRYKGLDLEIYKNNFHMLLDAINIGADIDIYQFDLFTSTADYQEIEALKKAYDTPKWKKLCAVVKDDEPRQDIKQIAFELNLDYNQSETQICNKLKQISLLDKNQFLESAIKRQEDRISTELADIDNFIPGSKVPKSRCSKKSTIIKNPYAYNDSRMAFYRDPEDGEIWCFTSDTFTNLIATKINPYTGKRLPDKFIETLKAQVNILKDLGVFNFNHSIKDTLKEFFERSTINNKKTDYAYNTVVKCLSLYGLSEERFNALDEVSLGETILNEICNVKLNFFDKLTPKHRVILTSRVIYSISKTLDNPAEFYQTITRAVVGNMDETIYEDEDQKEQENRALEDYLSLLE